MHDYDLFVIGAGSGGVRAARMSASFGAKVAIAEDNRLGGTCVNVGCVPKKLLVYASHVSEEVEDAASFGWQINDVSFDWPTLIANKDKEILRLNGIYRNLLVNAGVTLYEARAHLVDRHTVAVGGEQVTAKTILIATGSRVRPPEISGGEHAITSDDAFYLDDLPRRVAVVGSGYIAVEFAGIFNGMGAEVTEIFRADKVLRGFDEDVRSTLQAEMIKKGINLRPGTLVSAIAEQAGEKILALTDGSDLAVDQVLYAIGRVPNTEGLGLEQVGVETAKNGAILVDDFSQTSVDNIYAIGDVTDRINLTPVAIMEGMALARSLYAGQPTPVDHRDVPSAVFSQPPIGTVGLTEQQARAEFGTVDIYRSRFRPMKVTLTPRDEQTMMKLIVDAVSDRVVGVHVVGPDAGEIVQGVGIAVKMGATKAQFDATIGIHPTAAEELVTMREKATPTVIAAE